MHGNRIVDHFPRSFAVAGILFFHSLRLSFSLSQLKRISRRLQWTMSGERIGAGASEAEMETDSRIISVRELETGESGYRVAHFASR